MLTFHTQHIKEKYCFYYF